MRKLLQLVCCVSAGLLAAALGTGTTNAQNKADLKDLPKVQISGKVEGISPGYVKMSAESVRVVYGKTKADDNPGPRATDDELLKMKHVVAIDQRTKAGVTAQAGLEFIKPGVGLRLTGKVDGLGVVAGEVSAVEAFVPDANFKPSMELTVAFSGFVGDKKETVSPFKAEGVVVSSVKGKTVLLVKDNQRLQLTLSPAVKVTFGSPNYSLAQPGDHISVQGRLAAPGQIVGETVTVTLSTLPGESKKKTAPTTTKKKVEGKPEPKAKTEDEPKKDEAKGGDT